MGHPVIENNTPFAFETLFVNDEEGRPALATLLQAAYSVVDGPALPIEPAPVLNLAGERWYPDAPESSYKYEPQFALSKCATDVVLIGHAYADYGAATESIVSFEVGALRKKVRVIGDRYWIKSLTGFAMTSPEPFERIPLTYERAFGGWDRSHPDAQQHTFEPRNPVGTGFRAANGRFEEGIRLPNLEDPEDPVRQFAQKITPVGFGFISPGWEPRSGYSGTYDKKWMNERMPALPDDFNPLFFNAASPGLTAPGYLRGDEQVVILNASPSGEMRFNLPALKPPVCNVELTGRSHHELQTNLDTVIVNSDESVVLLLYRARLRLRTGPHDLISIRVGN